MLDLARRTVEVELERLEKEKKEEGQEEKVLRGRKEKLAEIHRLLGDVATESGELLLHLIYSELSLTMRCEPL